jgi:uncharacterized protein (TIGR03435 family)
MLQAGDFAPEIRFTKIMRSPGDAVWRAESFLGRLTVLEFFANVSDATEAFAELWNLQAERFADKPVQFILIARDGESDLELWLKKNPLQGWILLDSKWETARAWGIEMPQAVYIDADAKILGFDHHQFYNGSRIEQILAGHAAEARLRVKPRSFGGGKPDIPPSYTVHISPARRDRAEGASSSGGPTHWTKLGCELKAAIAQVYEIDESLIELPKELDNREPFDFELLLPQEESRDTMHGLVRQAIQQHFALTITRETRTMDVYILTAPNGAGPGLREAEFRGGGFIGTRSSPIKFDWTANAEPTLEDLQRAGASIHDLSASGMDMAHLCRTLETSLDRLVVDETGLSGSYDIQVSSSGDSQEDFFQALRDQLGLVLTPGRRDVEMLVAHR